MAKPFKRVLKGTMEFRWKRQYGQSLCLSCHPANQKRWQDFPSLYIGLDIDGPSRVYFVCGCPYIGAGEDFKTRREAQEAVEKALGLEEEKNDE